MFLSPSHKKINMKRITLRFHNSLLKDVSLQVVPESGTTWQKALSVFLQLQTVRIASQKCLLKLRGVVLDVSKTIGAYDVHDGDVIYVDYRYL